MAARPGLWRTVARVARPLTDRPGAGPGRPAASDSPDSLADAEIASYVARAQSRALENMPALSAFQRRAEQYPQLSASAQSELIVDFQAGQRAKEALRQGLKGAPERRAQASVRRAEHAIEYLVMSNFKLVLLITRENTEERYGRERSAELLPDLVAEANVALTEAVLEYDPERCPTFSTYAARRIRDHVRMRLTKEGPLRLAPSWSRLKRITAVRVPALAATLGRTPTKAEIQADLERACLEWAEGKLTDEQRVLPEPERHELKLAKLRKQGMLGAIRDLDDVLVATQSVTSLDTPVGEEGGSTMGELLAGTSGDSLFEGVELDELRNSLMAALDSLPQRDREIILYRFGFLTEGPDDDGKGWTYARIAERYGVTAERIRQIERNVLTRLRAPHAHSGALAAHLPSQFEVDQPAPVEGASTARRA